MKVLFLGDSITDAGRRTDENGMGYGYALYASQIIKSRHPVTEFEFINRGINGDKIIMLAERMQEDCIDLQPDVVSILIGINNTGCREDTLNWYTSEHFEGAYRQILTDIKTKTNAKIIILEEFLFPVPGKDHWRVDVNSKIDITRKLAREFADVYVPLDGLLHAHCLDAYPIAWSHDGVHPTEAAARLIAGYYADAFEKVFAKFN